MPSTRKPSDTQLTDKLVLESNIEHRATLVERIEIGEPSSWREEYKSLFYSSNCTHTDKRTEGHTDGLVILIK